jgi:Tfp pilus assembly protein PilF
VFYAQHRRYENAEQQFKTVISLTPDNTIGYNNLGFVFYTLGRFDEAAKAFEDSITIRKTGLVPELCTQPVSRAPGPPG